MGTSQLQEYVARKIFQEFGSVEIKENYRPEWLLNKNGNKIELDFYLPSYKVAIEVNGKQHYEYVPFFHGEYCNFEKQVIHDEIKKEICRLKNIRLFSITSITELQDIILYLKSIRNSAISYDEYVELRTKFFDKRIKSIRKGLKNWTKTLNKARGKQKIKEAKKHVNGYTKALEKATKNAERDFNKALAIFLDNRIQEEHNKTYVET